MSPGSRKQPTSSFFSTIAPPDAAPWAAKNNVSATAAAMSIRIGMIPSSHLPQDYPLKHFVANGARTRGLSLLAEGVSRTGLSPPLARLYELTDALAREPGCAAYRRQRDTLRPRRQDRRSQLLAGLSTRALCFFQLPSSLGDTVEESGHAH